MNVLIADDSKIIQKVVGRSLASIGHCEIEFADNGQQAIAAIQRQPFDFVICDFNMPLKDGI